VDSGEKEEVKESDFKKGGSGDEKGCIRDGGKEGQDPEQNQSDKTIDVNQKVS
jgi:hypothetical protein